MSVARARYKRRASRTRFEPVGSFKPKKASWAPSAGRPDFTIHTALPVKSRNAIHPSRALGAGSPIKVRRSNPAGSAAIGAAVVVGGAAAATAFAHSKTGKKLRRKVSNKMHHRGSSKRKRSGGGRSRQRRDRNGKFT